jgi:hypothetical protein
MIRTAAPGSRRRATRSSKRRPPRSSEWSSGAVFVDAVADSRRAHTVQGEIEEAVPVAATGADGRGHGADEHVDIGDCDVGAQRPSGLAVGDQCGDRGFEFGPGGAARFGLCGPSGGFDGGGQAAIARQHLTDPDQEFDGRGYTAGKGTLILLPRGIPHALRAVSTPPPRVLQISSPGGWEHYLEDLFEAGPTVLTEGRLDPAKINPIAAAYDITYEDR